MTQEYHTEKLPSPLNPEQWTYEHFLCLLLLYASYADFEYSPEERSHILTLIPQSILIQIEKIFESLGDFEQLDLILRLKERFVTTDDDRNSLFEHLENHFRSDGAFTRLESGLYQFLERLI